MNSNVKQNEVITGTIVEKDPNAISLLVPTAKKDRDRTALENRDALGRSLAKAHALAEGIAARLVLLLMLSPVKDGVDAISALNGTLVYTDENGESREVAIPKSAASKARTVHALVSRSGVSDTSDPRWVGAMRLANERGAKAIDAAIGRKQPQTVVKMLESIATAKPDGDKVKTAKAAVSAAIADAVPTATRKTGGTTKVEDKTPTRGQARATEVKALAATMADVQARLAVLLQGEQFGALTKAQRESLKGSATSLVAVAQKV